MRNHVIKVGSVTYAIKLKKLLTKYNISSNLIKNVGAEGCVYALEIKGEDYYLTAKIMRENNMSYPITENR